MKNNSIASMNAATEQFVLHYEDELKDLVNEDVEANFTNDAIGLDVAHRVDVIIQEIVRGVPEDFHARSMLEDEFRKVQRETIGSLATIHADNRRDLLNKTEGGIIC